VSRDILCVKTGAAGAICILSINDQKKNKIGRIDNLY
jgi:hypothetical protein